MARRGSIRQGFGGQYRRRDSNTSHSSTATTTSTYNSQTSPTVTSGTTAAAGPSIVPTPNTISPAARFNDPGASTSSFGDIFTAVLTSKLTKQQSVPKTPLPENHKENTPSASAPPPLPPKPQPKHAQPPPHYHPLVEQKPLFLEQTTLVCRVREDREVQLDTRCLRIIRKLSSSGEFVSIIRRFAGPSSSVEEDGKVVALPMAVTPICKSRLRCSCGVRAYLAKVLGLKEPQQMLSVSQTTLLFPGDGTTEQGFMRESTGSPNRYDSRRISRGSSSCLYESWADLEGDLRSNGRTSPTNGIVAPEVLLRRLARSISTRLAYKRNLLEVANCRVANIEKDSDMVSRVLRRVAEALPQMNSDSDVCYIHIPHIAKSSYSNSPSSFAVEVKVHEVFSAYTNMQDPLQFDSINFSQQIYRSMRLQESTANLPARFDRLLSSQMAVHRLLCQLTRRFYAVERRIEEIKIGEEQEATEDDMDAILVPLQGRRQQLEEQICEAQKLRDDLEGTKCRLLTGLQHQFYVTRSTVEARLPNGYRKTHSHSLSIQEDQDSYCFSDRSSPPSPRGNEVESVVSLAEFLSNHLNLALQTLVAQQSLETEILEDQETVDCIGEQLRLVASLSY